jgi:AMOP domain
MRKCINQLIFFSHDGAGQQCCYDLAGYLMMTPDMIGASAHAQMY